MPFRRRRRVRSRRSFSRGRRRFTGRRRRRVSTRGGLRRIGVRM